MTVQSPTELIIQIGEFYLLILVGYAIARSSTKSKTVNAYITDLLVKLLVPLLTIYTILTTSPRVLSELPTVIVLTILVHLLGPAILLMRLRYLEIDNATKGAFYTCVTFNNALFIPLPLVMIFIGESGVPFVILFSVVQLLLLASLGSLIGSAFGKRQADLKQIAKKTIVFPPLIAAILAIGLAFFGFALPEAAASVLSFSGPLTTYLSLVAVGLGVGVDSPIRDLRSALEIVAIRQIIVPLLTLPILILCSLSPVAFQVILIEAMMPPAVLTVVYAGWFGLNSGKAATIVTVGTLLLLPEIPLMLLLTN